jgi:hypothetical protein
LFFAAGISTAMNSKAFFLGARAAAKKNSARSSAMFRTIAAPHLAGIVPTEIFPRHPRGAALLGKNLHAENQKRLFA